MEIILLERVARLGSMGDVVTVKDGFARNYLIPQAKAMRATEANKVEFEARKGDIQKQNTERQKEAQKIASKLDGVKVELVRQASDDGRLYGSVTVRDIGEELEAKGFQLPRQNLLLERTIKTVGSFTVKVTPHPEVEIEIPVRVARNESEFLSWDEPEEEEVVEETAESEETTEATDATDATDESDEENAA